MKITNKSDIALELAVWLLDDNYDYIAEENYISATALMKPLRHILLPGRIPEEQRLVPDVEDFISRTLGHTIHAGIERAWKRGYKRALKLLGYPESVIQRVLINPTPEQLVSIPDPIPIYIEQRTFKEIDGYTIGGKFDLVCEGRVSDVKSTTAFTWLYGSKDEDYRLQGSIYRWLNPDKITEDYTRIHFVFTDWKKMDALQNPKYPQKRILHKDIPLLSVEETESWIRNKLKLIERYKNIEESGIPECTDEELWLSAPKFKYYADPTKVGGRSTKNFDDALEARKYMAEKGKGTIITIPGMPKRCEYCLAFPGCTQKDKYFNKEADND